MSTTRRTFLTSAAAVAAGVAAAPAAAAQPADDTARLLTRRGKDVLSWRIRERQPVRQANRPEVERPLPGRTGRGAHDQLGRSSAEIADGDALRNLVEARAHRGGPSAPGGSIAPRTFNLEKSPMNDTKLEIPQRGNLTSVPMPRRLSALRFHCCLRVVNVFCRRPRKIDRIARSRRIALLVFVARVCDCE